MKLNRKTLRRMILNEIKSVLLAEAEEVRDIKGNKILNPSRYTSEELEFLKQNPGVFARDSDVFPPEDEETTFRDMYDDIYGDEDSIEADIPRKSSPSTVGGYDLSYEDDTGEDTENLPTFRDMYDDIFDD